MTFLPESQMHLPGHFHYKAFSNDGRKEKHSIFHHWRYIFHYQRGTAASGFFRFDCIWRVSACDDQDFLDDMKGRIKSNGRSEEERGKGKEACNIFFRFCL